MSAQFERSGLYGCFELTTDNKSKVNLMINGWHLLWIVPLAAAVGIVVEAMLVVGDDDNDNRNRT